MKRKIDTEKFYTKPEIAKFCLEHLDLNKYDRIIEPSAGNGSFSLLVPNCEAYDLAPENENIKQQDFFDFSVKRGNILVFGNPPFGRQSSLAIKFINHAATFAKTVAFSGQVCYNNQALRAPGRIWACSRVANGDRL